MQELRATVRYTRGEGSLGKTDGEEGRRKGGRERVTSRRKLRKRERTRKAPTSIFRTQKTPKLTYVTRLLYK